MSDLTPLERLGPARDKPIHFAGRQEELAELNGILNRLCATGDPSAGISLVVGVPGSGKTQLAREFAMRSMKRDDMDVRWLNMNAATLNSGLGVFRAVARALGAEAICRAVAEMETRATSAGGGVSVVKGHAGWEHIRHTGDLDELLCVSKDRGAWDDKLLIVTIDELQVVQPQGMNALHILHQGTHGCPMMVVGVGLQHLQARLSKSGEDAASISRPANKFTLGPLARDEAVDAVAGNLEMLGQSPVSAESVVLLAEKSQGFPQHVHCYLRGALVAIARHGTLDSAPAMQTALAEGNRARAEYCNDRLRSLANKESMLPMAVAMIESANGALRRSELVKVANDAGFDGEAVVQDAIEQGVLTESPIGDLSFGIPSFHSHMARLVDRGRPPTNRPTSLGR